MSVTDSWTLASGIAQREWCACESCDLLLRLPELRGRENAECPRCGQVLERSRPDSLRRTLALATASLLLYVVALPSCGGVSAQGPAARCAEVVRIHKGLGRAVEVMGSPVETSEGNVEIEYEGTEDGVLPAKGTAACTFAVGAGGARSLVEAIVDGTPLGEQEIASIRRELGEGS
jgi:hypothetical protein